PVCIRPATASANCSRRRGKRFTGPGCGRSTMSAPSKCFADDMLLRYLDQRLSNADARAIERHVEGCRSCDEALARLAGRAGGRWADPAADLELRNGRHSAPGLADPDASQVAALLQAGGRYQVLGEIGRGGMGLVLRGRDHRLGRDLAFKVLKKEYRGQE